MFLVRKFVCSMWDDFEIIKIYMFVMLFFEGEVFFLFVYGKICYKIKVVLKEFLVFVIWI